jgi:hypothetical protein
MVDQGTTKQPRPAWPLPNSVRSAAIGRMHTKLLSPRYPSNSGVGRPTRGRVLQHGGLKRILRISWRMPPPPDKGKYPVTIYPITIYHGPQFRRDRIAAALPAATAVATSRHIFNRSSFHHPQIFPGRSHALDERHGESCCSSYDRPPARSAQAGLLAKAMTE